MGLFKRKNNKSNNEVFEIEVIDMELYEKAKSLVGQRTRINGVCGDIETIKLVKLISISEHNGNREVGFETDNPFYSRVFYNPETIMDWKYFKSI